MGTAILIIFGLLMLVVFFYSLSLLHLLINFRRSKKHKDSSQKWHFSDPFQIPFVTVQLPLYNDKPVVERLLRNISKLDYPHDKLQVQVLDDSTDDSAALTTEIISELRAEGFPIEHITRTHRKGFKAGALKAGMASAKGEFIAIFDSDFLPKPDWLKKTVPYFKDDSLGVVQTRWGHLNEDYSLLTRLQAFLLDYHFILEQTGRNFGKHFINFNGTAGIWRKSCILDAGNWEGDTLTEDLDLSYRAQLKGWNFKYLKEVVTPAELPITIEAARSQQFRWNKGAAENFQKNYRKVLKDKNATFGTRVHSFFHLLNSSFFFVVLLMGIISIPVLFLLDNPSYSEILTGMTVFILSPVIFFVTYYAAYRELHKDQQLSIFRFTGLFFTFFSIAMGLSLHNSIAILEGHFGKKSEFIRTPKFNLGNKSGAALKQPVKITFQLILEILLMLLFAFGIFSSFRIGNYSLLPFHLMMFFGFSYVVLASLNVELFRGKKSDLTGFQNL
ncbi:glycosyltransferase family 2 protein [Salinimicrobium sp. MT39]|uniref:Glycosyltransferase family 2 protein n=1 Tax=Salinimicrobium profundisediminis TaxID=2994553 RepID=A0A9X3CWK8_9FLAO|nr:cellulose synthase family protein [Salinimicrobium profundisediminis]MCX2838141.1 glycosyltransferase family 2 protein [Salinimicrobium profundisediminis]